MTTVKWEVAVTFDDNGKFEGGVVALNGHMAGRVTELKSHLNINGGEIHTRFTTDHEFWTKMQPLVRMATDEEMEPAVKAMAKSIQEAEDARFLADVELHIERHEIPIRFQYAGSNCSECGEPQYRTPSGPCCENGHGGAPPKGGD